MEDHFIEVQFGATAVDIVIPATLEPTTTFKLRILGQFRDRPVISASAASAIQITVPNVILSDTNIVGTTSLDAVEVDDGIDNNGHFTV